mgnify:CR=1 FL=1
MRDALTEAKALIEDALALGGSIGAGEYLLLVPPFGSALVDSGAACASAYARVEGGAYGPCHVMHGECRNAAEALQCR